MPALHYYLLAFPTEDDARVHPAVNRFWIAGYWSEDARLGRDWVAPHWDERSVDVLSVANYADNDGVHDIPGDCRLVVTTQGDDEALALAAFAWRKTGQPWSVPTLFTDPHRA